MEVVHGAFRQRRKTLQNNLNQHFTSLSKEEVTAILEEANILPNRRGESLSIKEFAHLCVLSSFKGINSLFIV